MLPFAVFFFNDDWTGHLKVNLTYFSLLFSLRACSYIREKKITYKLWEISKRNAILCYGRETTKYVMSRNRRELECAERDQTGRALTAGSKRQKKDRISPRDKNLYCFSGFSWSTTEFVMYFDPWSQFHRGRGQRRGIAYTGCRNASGRTSAKHLCSPRKSTSRLTFSASRPPPENIAWIRTIWVSWRTYAYSCYSRPRYSSSLTSFFLVVIRIKLDKNANKSTHPCMILK